MLDNGNDLDKSMALLRKKGIGPGEMQIAIARVMNISLRDADKILLNSAVWADIRSNTMKIRKVVVRTIKSCKDDYFSNE